MKTSHSFQNNPVTIRRHTMSAFTALFLALIVTANCFNWNRKLQLGEFQKPGTSIETPDEEDESQPVAYPPLYHHNVKSLLQKAVLRPKLLPGLKYRKPKPLSTINGAAKLGRLIPQFKLPKLVLKPISLEKSLLESGLPKPKPSNVIENPKKTSFAIPGMLAAGEFPLKIQKSKPTWLMAIGDLRSETCRAEKYNRTITSKGCKPLVIESKYCTGRCNSFFVPSQKADFQSCSSCFPSKHNIIMIMLECPERKRGYKVKQVQMIEECMCQSVIECSN